MSALKILTYPDPELKKTSKPVEKIDDSIIKLIDDMADTMYAIPGVGLAAPQVGVLKRIIIYDAERKDLEEENLSEAEKIKRRNLKILINPNIISSRGKCTSEKEGCLSVPDLRANINRASDIHVEALNIKGKKISFETSETEAIVIQHEIDHLNGILFIDYLSTLKREMYRRRRIKTLKKRK